MRELVREDEPQPVGRLQVVRPGRPRGRDDDRVAREERDVAAEEIRLVDDDHVGHARRRRAEWPSERTPGVLCDNSQALSQSVFTLMEVDDEVLGAQRPETIGGIEGRCGVGSNAPETDEQRQHDWPLDSSRRAAHDTHGQLWHGADLDFDFARPCSETLKDMGNPLSSARHAANVVGGDALVAKQSAVNEEGQRPRPLIHDVTASTHSTGAA